MARKKTHFDRADALVERLREFTVAPPRSSREWAVHDAWKVAVQPRARRMIRRAEKIADGASWEYDDARRPIRLRARAMPT